MIALEKIEKHVKKELYNIEEWCKSTNCKIPNIAWPAIRHALRTMCCITETDNANDIFKHSLEMFEKLGFWKDYNKESNVELCRDNVLEVLRNDGPMTIAELYRKLPNYRVGNCEIDAAMRKLHEDGLVYSNGKRDIQGWGRILLWHIDSQATRGKIKMKKVHYKVVLDVLVHEDNDVNGKDMLREASFWPEQDIFDNDVLFHIENVDVQSVKVTDSH